MNPTTLARSIVRNGMARPRTFSASAQKMWPPSRGRNGNEVDDRERQRDQAEDGDRLRRRRTRTCAAWPRSRRRCCPPRRASRRCRRRPRRVSTVSLGDLPHRRHALARRLTRAELLLGGLEAEADQRPFALLVVDSGRSSRSCSRPSRTIVSRAGVGGLAALDLLARAACAWRAARAALSALPRTPSTATMLVALAQHALGGAVRGATSATIGSRRPVGVGDRRRREEPPQDHEGQDEVDERPGADDEDPLPHRLAVVGPRRHLGREHLRRVHPGDLHEAAERDRPDAVRRSRRSGFTTATGPKKSENFSTRMPDHLGRGEVARLVRARRAPRCRRT